MLENEREQDVPVQQVAQEFKRMAGVKSDK